MITPKDVIKLELSESSLEELEKQIDAEIKKNHKKHSKDWETAILKKEYSLEVRNAIAHRYIEAGWNHVYHQVSSDEGYDDNKTYFRFSTVPLFDGFTLGWRHVCKQK